MWAVPSLLLNSVFSIAVFVQNCEIILGESTTLSSRWLGDILEDTDASLSSLLSQQVDGERAQFALQFVLGYQGLMERLRDAARTQDPRTLEVFRQLKTRDFRPAFLDLLPNLSLRQKELGWNNENLDALRTAVIRIRKIIEEFKGAVTELL